MYGTARTVESRTAYRDELRAIVEELAAELGFTPHELRAAGASGSLPATREAHVLAVFARLVD